ncbi:MAG: hypothetical protein JWO36_3751 [Myxococcales bacterium]|nr:hypothetical protein [Myxococcales bacterium]
MKRLVLALLVTGCGNLAKNGETLTESVRSYNDGVRWERFATAAIHVPPKQRAQFVDDWDQRANDLKISDYEVVKVDQKGTQEAHVQVKLSWYKNSEGTLHETQALQTWERHGKDWILVDEARLRGPEMPGLPEPLMKD